MILAVASLVGVSAAENAVAASLAGRLDASLRVAGPRTGALVQDLTSGTRIYARRASVRRLPASVEKLWTTSTALRRYGAAHTFRTAVLAMARPSAGGTVAGNLYLRGAGDPNFGAVDTGALALALRRAGVRRVTGHVVGDESRFDPFRGVPTSFLRPSPDVEPLSALVYARDKYRGRYVTSPPRYAAGALTLALGRAGVKVRNKHAGAGRTPPGARRLAVIGSPRVGTLIAETNRPSDNFFAETLLKDLGADFGEKGSTAAGAAVVRAEARALGLHPAVTDGSGLSRRDATSPAQIVGLLQAMRRSATFRASLAHFGRPGDTLEDRLKGTYAARHCAAKTGSLHDVSSLAGYCTAPSGHLLAFGIFMSGIHSVDHARALQDAMITTLLSSALPGSKATPPSAGGGAQPRR